MRKVRITIGNHSWVEKTKLSDKDLIASYQHYGQMVWVEDVDESGERLLDLGFSKN